MRRHDLRAVQPLLAVEGLSKSFGKARVLDDVSFWVDRGEIVCLNGGNGAGKSTVQRCILGLADADGSVRLDGVDPRRDPRVRSRIGYLPQTAALLETATGREALAFLASLRGVEPTSHPLPETFLPPMDTRLGTLSTGQRQRVALTAALLGHPDLLLLDEPVANLDAEARQVVWSVLRDLAEGGIAVVIASPAPQELAGVARRLIHLEVGRVAGDGPMPELGVLTSVEAVGEEGP